MQSILTHVIEMTVDIIVSGAWLCTDTAHQVGVRIKSVKRVQSTAHEEYSYELRVGCASNRHRAPTTGALVADWIRQLMQHEVLHVTLTPDSDYRRQSDSWAPFADMTIEGKLRSGMLWQRSCRLHQSAYQSQWRPSTACYCFASNPFDARTGLARRLYNGKVTAPPPLEAWYGLERETDVARSLISAECVAVLNSSIPRSCFDRHNTHTHTKYEKLLNLKFWAVDKQEVHATSDDGPAFSVSKMHADDNRPG
jgi:hypothetical protein